MATAESVIVELEARVGGFTGQVRDASRTFEQSMSNVERSAQSAETGVRRFATSVVQSSTAAGQSSRLLGYQISDIGAQLASGQSPFLILAQQAPQVANALEGTAGKAGQLAAFFSGPWGAALLAAGSILGVLTGKLLESGDAATSKKSAFEELAKAIRDAEAASRAAIASTQREIFFSQASANAKLQEVVATRELTKARLTAAQANLRGAQTAALSPNSGLTPEERLGALGASSGYERQVQQIQAVIRQQDALARVAQANVTRTGARVVQQRVAESLDPAAAATGRYERRVDLLNSALTRGRINEAQYEKAVRAATAARDTALKATQRQGSASTALADAEGRLAGSSGAVARASAQLGVERAKARAELKAGTITQAEYTARIAEATRAVEGARSGIKADAQAKRDQAAATREAKQEAEELKREFEQLQQTLDPAAASARSLNETMQSIAKVRLGGLIDDAQAFNFAIEAGRREAERLSKAQNDSARRILGDPGKEVDDIVAKIDRERDARLEAGDEVARRQEDQIFALADLYESAFRGGAKGLWETFRDEGLRAIAQVLAKWTISSLGGTGGGLGGLTDLLGSAIGSLFGRASGGYVSPGQMVRVNEGSSPGRVEGFRAAGSGTIVPLGQMNAMAQRGGPTIVQQTFVLDARGGVTTTDLLEQMNNLAAEAAAAGAQGGRALALQDFRDIGRKRL